MDTISPFIRQCYPVAGDWFVYERRHDRDSDRWFLRRIVLWAVIEQDHRVSHVQAVLGHGMPHKDGDNDDSYFVYGPDRSPAGITWKKLYDRIAPPASNSLEITDFINSANQAASVSSNP